MSSLNLYPEVVYDLTPEIGSDVDEKVEKILEATKGFGTNEKGLIEVLANCTPHERCLLDKRFEETHGKELKKVMKKETGNRNFGTALQLLALSPDEAECEIITKASRGVGTDETLLYSVICGRSNEEINHLKKKFFDIHSKDLGTYCDKELGGKFEKLIFNCLQGTEEKFDVDYHTDELVDEDVASFYKMGEDKFGTDEEGLFKLLCQRPSQHLIKVNEVYTEKYDVTLYHVMKKELGGDTRDATLFLLGMKLKPYETIAKLIDSACKGVGTDELLLSCTIIRYQMCLKQVMDAYNELKGDPLQETIKKEVRGDYEDLLVAICDAAAAN